MNKAFRIWLGGKKWNQGEVAQHTQGALQHREIPGAGRGRYSMEEKGSG